jgi:hypothetical protein
MKGEKYPGTTPRDIIVESWNDLCDKLFIDSWQPDINRFRSNYAFRGVSDTSYQLKTSLMRLCPGHPHLEYHLLRNFRKYAEVPNADSSSSDWWWLTIAQHHGLPTRLLDWTYSPFVATHFATAETAKLQCDGAIWFVDFVKVNHMLPEPLSGMLVKTGANAFTLDMIQRVHFDIADFDALGPDFAMFFEPPSVDARIVNQFALFSAMSGPMSRLDSWLLAHPDIYGRIIIPKELKWEVRDKLDQSNITERTLFPGLDGLAAWLKRHYTPRC